MKPNKSELLKVRIVIIISSYRPNKNAGENTKNPVENIQIIEALHRLTCLTYTV